MFNDQVRLDPKLERTIQKSMEAKSKKESEAIERDITKTEIMQKLLEIQSKADEIDRRRVIRERWTLVIVACTLIVSLVLPLMVAFLQSR